MSITNMAYYDGELGAAFRFSEIMDHIARIGWGKYISTYIVLALIGLVGMIIGVLIGVFTFGIGMILLILIIAPYIWMFAARGIALLFAYSGEPDAVEEAPVE